MTSNDGGADFVSRARKDMRSMEVTGQQSKWHGRNYMVCGRKRWARTNQDTLTWMSDARVCRLWLRYYSLLAHPFVVFCEGGTFTSATSKIRPLLHITFGLPVRSGNSCLASLSLVLGRNRTTSIPWIFKLAGRSSNMEITIGKLSSVTHKHITQWWIHTFTIRPLLPRQTRWPRHPALPSVWFSSSGKDLANRTISVFESRIHLQLMMDAWNRVQCVRSQRVGWLVYPSWDWDQSSWSRNLSHPDLTWSKYLRLQFYDCISWILELWRVVPQQQTKTETLTNTCLLTRN